MQRSSRWHAPANACAASVSDLPWPFPGPGDATPLTSAPSVTLSRPLRVCRALLSGSVSQQISVGRACDGDVKHRPSETKDGAGEGVGGERTSTNGIMYTEVACSDSTSTRSLSLPDPPTHPHAPPHKAPPHGNTATNPLKPREPCPPQRRPLLRPGSPALRSANPPNLDLLFRSH